ncbi:hypothetical protein CDAR_403961 [Caerostris darwini]|uniref:Uncharacterized protein n=1 Tax=Caerostris darwini TaxID=1538125 RepID=A0AAV4SQR4_9ARAC|nr:hypothetical protein CDAR_403961 [Caerostris darwini]
MTAANIAWFRSDLDSQTPKFVFGRSRLGYFSDLSFVVRFYGHCLLHHCLQTLNRPSTNASTNINKSGNFFQCMPMGFGQIVASFFHSIKSLPVSISTYYCSLEQNCLTECYCFMTTNRQCACSRARDLIAARSL